MFWPFKKKTAPAKSLATAPPPLRTVEEAAGSLQPVEKPWYDSEVLTGDLARLLTEQGIEWERDTHGLTLTKSGLILRTQLDSASRSDEGRVQTCTLTEVSHPTAIPQGVFEFQHSWGIDYQASVEKGFRDWMGIDLPALLDALRTEPETCTCMEMKPPGEAEGAAQTLRIVLGPVWLYGDEKIFETEGEHDPGCPCCLFTNAYSALEPVFMDERFHAIRFFAARQKDGSTQADCRVNGENWEAGAKLLREYASTWPERGIEFRKQYIIAQRIPARVQSSDG